MKATKKLITIALFGLSVTAQADVTTVTNNIRQKYPNTQVTSITQVPQMPSLYEIVMGNNIAYTDDKADYIVFGHIFDMRTKTDITQNRLQQINKIDFASLPFKDAIVTKLGNGKAKLAVFSDPDCPYCRQLETTLPKLHDVTIYTFMMPLTQLHPDSMRHATSIWCSEHKNKTMQDVMLNNAEPAEAHCATPLNDNLKLAQEHNINGTPTLIFESGEMVPGAIPLEAIEQKLQQKQ